MAQSPFFSQNDNIFVQIVYGQNIADKECDKGDSADRFQFPRSAKRFCHRDHIRCLSLLIKIGYRFEKRLMGGTVEIIICQCGNISGRLPLLGKQNA